MNIRPVSQEDVIVWCDGTWCFREELHEVNWMSDDYLVIPAGSLEAEAFLAKEQVA